MIGNDDCGQMSAWYILSSLGFYPVNPAEGTFVLGSPQVKKAILQLGQHKRFVIKAQHLSEANIYQENPTLNKQVLDTPILRYTEIMSGGVLKFHMQNH
jgi:putative alpha-1,2-mannosidase